MFTTLLQAGPPAGAAAGGGILALFASFWCCAIVLGIGQFVIFIIALVQILSRDMATENKVLWCCVIWFVPLVGPILWWTIGAKQNPPGPSNPSNRPPFPPQ